MIYQAEFTEEYLERKLVVSVYCNRRLQLERVDTDPYPREHFEKLELSLIHI